MTDRRFEVTRSVFYMIFAIWSTIATVHAATDDGWKWVHVAVLAFDVLVLAAGAGGLLGDFRGHGAHLLMAVALIGLAFCLIIASFSPFGLLTFALGVQELHQFRTHQSPAEGVQRGSGGPARPIEEQG